MDHIFKGVWERPGSKGISGFTSLFENKDDCAKSLLEFTTKPYWVYLHDELIPFEKSIALDYLVMGTPVVGILDGESTIFWVVKEAIVLSGK